jgi:hypothetical protein
MSLVQQYLKPMKDAISNVLETMFYVVPLFESNGSQGCGSVLSFDLESNIEILDESEGMELYFRVTEHFARIITANFLDETGRGEEGSWSPEIQAIDDWGKGMLRAGINPLTTEL